ncbi:trafficking protein particle complex subunit 3 [Planoprotostelium fungivorum]|uniref:Trafficking protein particle complex subunit n=1 Tax=Planoprotostelium fungivorum TaxID=1890364 RepID=A0A2P6N5N3_9EUKA|nr:trafficking protein particle complex subunit 3 [Planoprotostelium fungivorum]
MASKPNYARIGDQVFRDVEKINAELFTLTYGAIVAQLLKDFEDVEEVNNQLEKMGYNIGLRLIEEFLARSNVPRCSDFKDTAEVISKVGFKMFLGINATVTNWDPKKPEFSLVLEENPLIDFVEVPEQYQSLVYSNILCGVIRGALEMVQMSVECRFVRDVLKGDDASELKVTLKAMLEEEVPVGED